VGIGGEKRIKKDRGLGCKCMSKRTSRRRWRRGGVTGWWGKIEWRRCWKIS
jgi:hypothetical protein